MMVATLTTFLSAILTQYILNNWEDYLHDDCWFCMDRSFLYNTLHDLFQEYLPEPHYSAMEKGDLFYPLPEDLAKAMWLMKQSGFICTKSDEQLHPEFTLRILRGSEEKDNCQKRIDSMFVDGTEINGEKFSQNQRQAFPKLVTGLELIRNHLCPDDERHRYPNILPVRMTY